MPRKTLSYKDSGVDIDSNTRWVDKIQSAMHATHSPRVIGHAGAFAGMFQLNPSSRSGSRYTNPVLVACADGVGTKVLLAIKTGKLDGLGIDLVAMNVNDVITCGAEPLFFLDYVAVHKLDPDTLLPIVEGIAEGCRQSGCALLGGETAEMPDLYRPTDFDLAGFTVGVVPQNRIIDKSRVSPGDTIIGLPSSGVHSNGFSLVRKLLAARRVPLSRRLDRLGESVADALLKPTTIYVADVHVLLGGARPNASVTAMAHITGGGLPENVARALGPNCDAIIDTDRWTPPPIFPYLQHLGVDQEEMFRVFNMGIGFVFVVRNRDASGVLRKLETSGAQPVVIGDVTHGSGEVRFN